MKEDQKDSDAEDGDTELDLLDPDHSGKGHGHSHEHGGCSHVRAPVSAGEDASILPFLLTAVLCFHSFIGGMALGVQTDPAKMMMVFIAIISHKWVEAFSLGVSFVRSNASFKVKSAVLDRLVSLQGGTLTFSAGAGHVQVHCGVCIIIADRDCIWLAH